VPEIYPTGLISCSGIVINMKLLLTSGGLRNATLKQVFLKMVGKPADEIKVAFIPTAMNVEPGDKGWAIDQLNRIRELGVKQLDIVDIAAVSKEIWLPRLEDSNVIYVNGGNTTYLMECFNSSGLTQEIHRLLEDRAYVGGSAGSYIVTPDIRFNTDDVDEVLDGLNLVDFGLQVHLNSPKFPQAKTIEAMRDRARGCPYVVYALDDEMAIKVEDGVIEFVGEGKYEVIEPTE
jgi:dipeptidase E